MKRTIQLFTLFLLTASCVQSQPSESEDPNTVIIRQQGKIYQLFAIGDKLPTFSINGEEIAKENFEDYKPMFSDLQNQLEEKKHKPAQKARVFAAQSRANLVSDLVKDKLVGSASELTSFKLDNNSFTINGQKQSFETFTRYKDKYLRGVNYIIQFN